MSSHPCLPWCPRSDEQEGPFAPQACPRFTAPTDPSATLASSVDVPGYRCYDLPCSAAFPVGRGGLLPVLRASLSPCRRSHPAGVVRRVSQAATTHTAFAFPVAGSASGAPHVRGHRCVRVRYGLETRPHPDDESVERLQKVGVPSPCSPSDRALAFPLIGFSPTEHTSLRWTHNRACTFQRTRLSTLPQQMSPVRQLAHGKFLMAVYA